MSTGAPTVTRLMCSGSVTLRQRPTRLVMRLVLHAAEATLELGLANLRKRCAAASQWLKRLDADAVEMGEPHFAGQAESEPAKQMRAATAMALTRRTGKAATAERRREVNVVATATWPIADKSSEETLVLMDRLQFELAHDAGTSDVAEEPPEWFEPEEQMQAMLARMTEPPPVDRAPQFLFIATVSEKQLAQAYAEAFAMARQQAEQLTQAMNMRAYRLASIHPTFGALDPLRTDRIMARHRCAALLAGCTLDLTDHDIVSDSPLPAEVVVKVDLHLEVE